MFWAVRGRSFIEDQSVKREEDSLNASCHWLSHQLKIKFTHPVLSEFLEGQHDRRNICLASSC
jgi:ABC-type transport system involved in cytochrome c biogenesis ATPase subunit